MNELIFAGFCFLGSLFCLISTLGLFRFPDLYSRLHAAGITPSLGLLFLLLAGFGFFPLLWMAGYLVLMITVNFLTSPLTAHLIARTAYLAGIPLGKKAVRDEGRSKRSSL